jgi:hypothetical protein
MERVRGINTRYALSLPLRPRTSAGWPPTCVSVTVNEARRYLATSDTRLIVSRCRETRHVRELYPLSGQHRLNRRQQHKVPESMKPILCIQDARLFLLVIRNCPLMVTTGNYANDDGKYKRLIPEQLKLN